MENKDYAKQIVERARLSGFTDKEIIEHLSEKYNAAIKAISSLMPSLVDQKCEFENKLRTTDPSRRIEKKVLS